MQQRLLPLTVVVLAMVSGSKAQQPLLRGFGPAHSQRERELEQKFMAVPDPKQAEVEHATMTAEPHIAGSAADHRLAEYVLRQFRSLGFEATIEEFDVLLSEPHEIKLDLMRPVKFSGPSREFVDVDPASRDSRNSIGFNAYSASGDVIADVIFANYGLPSDYERLRAMGISPKGKIAIVRRGDLRVFRGVKAKVAEENGVAGLIIYTDPEDDGYHAGDTYPKGPWRPTSGVQRGTLLYEFLSPGDPTTPDGPSIPGATRTDPAQIHTLPRIVVLPLSSGDARRILENLRGPAAPRTWQGGLPMTYHVGPGPANVRLRVQMDNVVKPIWIVVAKIVGAEHPDEIVILGNHHDAWTYGGVDPASGTVATLEMARGFSELMRGGWRPRRSIWLCSWDAEEQGMIGSTEWAEKHAPELQAKAVAYLNLDVAVSGEGFSTAAVPSLKQFMRDVGADVPHPNGGSILERTNEEFREQLRENLLAGKLPEVELGRFEPISERQFEIGDLGSGTDFAPFIDHLGIASTDFMFGGDYGAYHSIFDNHRWMKEFGDPGFRYHVAAARYYGLLTLRLAQSDLLPFDYQTYGEEIEGHLSVLRHRLALQGQSDQLDLSPAFGAARRLIDIGREIQERYGRDISQGLSPANLDRMNWALASAERSFLLPEGLPGRPWYKHVVFAPGIYSADAAMPLPGVQQSIDAHNFGEARRQLDALIAALNRVVESLKHVE